MKRSKPKRKIAGTGQAAARDREDKFIATYMGNNQNGTRAALAAGFSPKGAEVMACRLLKRVRVKNEIERRKKELLAKFELTPDRVLREMARIAYFDVAHCFDESGQFKKIHDIDEDTRRAIAQMKDGEVKPFSKPEALRAAMQYLDLLPRQGSSLKATLTVAAEEVKQMEPEKRNLYDIGRRIAFVLSMTAEMNTVATSTAPVRPPL